jgi:aryl-alcohol dehydrogenase-like predicted oxidoreductase
VRHRTLGHTGLIVSEVALGSMQFGGRMNMGNLGQDETNRMVKLALDRGIKSGCRWASTSTGAAPLA